MTRLVTFTTEEGADVTVQVPDDGASPAGPVTRGWGTASSEERSDRKLDDALAKVQPAVLALLGKLRALADTPDEIEGRDAELGRHRQPHGPGPREGNRRQVDERIEREVGLVQARVR